MKEWSNLERTRALSHSEGSQTGTDVPPPSTPSADLLSATPPSGTPPSSHREPASGAGVGSGDQNRNGTEAGGGNLKGKEGEVVTRFLSAR